MSTSRRWADKVPQSTIDHFSSMPLAQPTLSDPLFRPIPNSRNLTHQGRGHTLMAKTWNTPDTIHDVLSFWRSSPTTANSTSYPEPESTRAEIRRFYTLGGDLNAHPDLLHGGVIACLLDSTLGRAIFLALSDLGFEGESQFTVQLNVTYKKAVKTPSTVVARAWVTGLEGDGRKIWAKGCIEGGNGVVFAEAEGMWLRPKVKKAAKI